MKKNRFVIAMLWGVAFLLMLSCYALTAGRGPLKFDPANLPDAQVGVPYDAKVTITQNVTPAGSFSISDGALPKGLTMEKVQDENSARISGTPEEAGAFTFKISVWCYGTNVSGQTGEMSYTIMVGR